LGRLSSGTLCLFLGTTGGFLGLALRHLLSGTLRGLLLRSHLLFFSAACLLLSLTLGHFLGTTGGRLFGLTLCHLLGAAFGLLLRSHLLLFRSLAGGFFLLALHGDGFRLLTNLLCFHGGLFGGHALLGGQDFPLLLHRRSFNLLAGFFGLNCRLFGGHALLRRESFPLLCFSGRGCGLLGSHFLGDEALLHGSSGLSLLFSSQQTSFSSFGGRVRAGGLFSGHFLGGGLLCCGGIRRLWHCFRQGSGYHGGHDDHRWLRSFFRLCNRGGNHGRRRLRLHRFGLRRARLQ
jgi:hypothetical protein